MLDEKKPLPCISDAFCPPSPPLRTMKHGVYAVVYENPSPLCWTSNIRAWTEQYFVPLTHLSYAGRLLSEIFLLAPGLLIGYICATLWISISDALVLLFLGSIFSFVSDDPDFEF